MKKVGLILMVLVVLAAITAPAWAEGDQLHGEIGAGSTVRTSNPWI